MNSYTKVLISSMGALLATKAEAGGIYNSCLELSDDTISSDFHQTFFTNEADLTTSSMTSDMALDGFNVCTDGDRNVKGLQFFLSETPYLVDDYAELFFLDPIGKMTGECGSLRFSGPVDQMKAAEKKKKEIRAIAFHYDNDKVV